MRLHLVMPPPPHAATGAAWNSARSDDPLHIQSSTSVPAVQRKDSGTVLIVPAAALSWHRAQLPPGLLGNDGQARNAAKLRTALDGLLEDQLLDEPAALHLALHPEPTANGLYWVAACNRAWLRSTLEALLQAGHTVRKVVPEWAPSEARPEAPSNVWLTGDAGAFELVWTDSYGVHRWPVHNVHELAPASLPANCVLYAEPTCAALAEKLLQREAIVQNRAQRLKLCLGGTWNLAQGEFATRNAWMRRLGEAASNVLQAPAWRPARWALVLLALVQIVGLNVQAWQARQALSAQHYTIGQILMNTFPSTTVVVDAPLQMQRAVATLGQTSGQAQAQDLERILEAFGALAPANIAPAAIDFVAGELRIGQWSAAPEDNERLRAGLAARGYRMRQDGSNLVISP